jgi:hypothetical protein
MEMAKTPLQSRFTLLKSKFFPAKFPFSKIQKKNLAGKIYFAKERGPMEIILIGYKMAIILK